MMTSRLQYNYQRCILARQATVSSAVWHDQEHLQCVVCQGCAAAEPETHAIVRLQLKKPTLDSGNLNSN